MSMTNDFKSGISALALAMMLSLPTMALAEGDDPAPEDDGIAWAGGSPDFCESCGGEVIDGEPGDDAAAEDPGVGDDGAGDDGAWDDGDVAVDPRDGCENCRGDDGDGTDGGDGDGTDGDDTAVDDTGYDETGVGGEEGTVEDTPVDVTLTSTGGPDVRRDVETGGGTGNGAMANRESRGGLMQGNGCLAKTGPTLAFLCNQ